MHNCHPWKLWAKIFIHTRRLLCSSLCVCIACFCAASFDIFARHLSSLRLNLFKPLVMFVLTVSARSAAAVTMASATVTVGCVIFYFFAMEEDGICDSFSSCFFHKNFVTLIVAWRSSNVPRVDGVSAKQGSVSWRDKALCFVPKRSKWQLIVILNATDV